MDEKQDYISAEKWLEVYWKMYPRAKYLQDLEPVYLQNRAPAKVVEAYKD